MAVKDKHDGGRAQSVAGAITLWNAEKASFARIHPTTTDEADELYSDEVGVTETCYCGGTLTLLQCYCDVTAVLLWCYYSVTTVLLWCY
ncbi:hypothetical protein KSS87_014463 [Heliosperma pusillum]|nr:hypothetical protein KSS87_014463 [Heliosperma pusillum]